MVRTPTLPSLSATVILTQLGHPWSCVHEHIHTPYHCPLAAPALSDHNQHALIRYFLHFPPFDPPIPLSATVPSLTHIVQSSLWGMHSDSACLGCCQPPPAPSLLGFPSLQDCAPGCGAAGAGAAAESGGGGILPSGRRGCCCFCPRTSRLHPGPLLLLLGLHRQWHADCCGGGWDGAGTGAAEVVGTLHGSGGTRAATQVRGWASIRKRS